jgi:hypothetical protein
MHTEVDPKRLEIARAIVRKIFQRDPNTDEGVGMDPNYLANLLDGPIAKWVSQTTVYRWIAVHTADVTGVTTVANLINLCYFHLIPASALTGSTVA